MFKLLKRYLKQVMSPPNIRSNLMKSMMILEENQNLILINVLSARLVPLPVQPMH